MEKRHSWKLALLGRVVNTGKKGMVVGGALGHQVSYLHSRREPPVLAFLIVQESDLTSAASKMVFLGQIQQVMTLCVKSWHFNSYDPKLNDEGVF